MTPNLLTLDLNDAARWDALVALHPHATVFQTSRWAQTLATCYGHRVILLAEMDGDKPRALLPVLEVNSFLKGRRGVSLPFSDEGGLLCFDGNTGAAVFDAALDTGRARGWKHLEIRGNIPSHPDASPTIKFIGHEATLDGGAEAVFERFESGVRRAIRKAEKSGVTAEVLKTDEAIRIYHCLHCETRRKHGVPPQSLDFFLQLHRHVIQSGFGFVVVARYEGEPVASGVFLHHGPNAIYKFGASVGAALSLRGNDLVMWTAMKHCASLGCRTFSMGRTDADNEGLRRFKRGFGAEEKSVFYHRYNLQQNSFLPSSKVSATGISRGLNGFARLLPMPLFRFAGRILYPQMD